MPGRETRLMAETLYFGLTTGTGLSTLGEEYCDILQVAGGSILSDGKDFCAVFMRQLHEMMLTS